MLALPVLLLAAATTVLGHGYVQEVVGSSGKYTGYLPYNDPYTTPAPQRIIRKFPSNGPVQDVKSMDIQCNVGAVPAPITASFAAGSNVALNWTTWPESHVGPLITYMARAPSDVTKWSPGTSAVWFKIDEQGLSNGKWAATDVLTENKSIYTFKIPASLKAGQYLIRHEIIALHAASSEGGAQFYPSCTQVQVTGSGTETGPASLVAFPGAYKSTDPGILYNAYGGSTTYPIPGPPVWTGGSSSGNAPVPVTSPTTANTTPRTTTTKASSPTTAPSGSGSKVPQYGQCAGRTYSGPTVCTPPQTCKYNNDYYSQCL